MRATRFGRPVEPDENMYTSGSSGERRRASAGSACISMSSVSAWPWAALVGMTLAGSSQLATIRSHTPALRSSLITARTPVWRK